VSEYAKITLGWQAIKIGDHPHWVVLVRWLDEHDRRCARIVAEIFEQAGDPLAAEQYAKFLANSANLQRNIGEIAVTTRLMMACKDHPELDALLKRAAEKYPTPAKLKAQRRSWVSGEAAIGGGAVEAAYRAAMERGDEDALRRLDEEAEARRQRALKWMDENDV